MVPTIPWMKQKFAEYNEKYFGGKLPTPNFSIEALDGEWGRYDLDADFNLITRKIPKTSDTGTIILTNQFSRPENAVISTLLHEMCHEYVYLVMGIYPKDVHGKEFMAIANQINGEGWAIARETPFTDDDIEGEENPDVGCILCVIEFEGREDFKWWVSKVDGQDINTARATAQSIKGFKNVGFFDCKSNALYHVKSDPQNLPGWGGMVYRNVAVNIARYCGEQDFHIFMKDQLTDHFADVKKQNGQSADNGASAQQQQPAANQTPAEQPSYNTSGTWGNANYSYSNSTQEGRQPRNTTLISEGDIRLMVLEAVNTCLRAKK